MWTKNIWIRVIGPVYFVHFPFQIEVGQPAHFLNLFWLVIMGYVVKSHWLVTFATWFLLKRIGMFWSFTKKDRWKRGWSLMDNNLNIIIVTLDTQGLPSSLSYCVCSLHTHHTHDLKTLSAFYFHAKRTVGSRVPWRISPTVIQVDLKTEQNKTK